MPLSGVGDDATLYIAYQGTMCCPILRISMPLGTILHLGELDLETGCLWDCGFFHET